MSAGDLQVILSPGTTDDSDSVFMFRCIFPSLVLFHVIADRPDLGGGEAQQKFF